VSKYGPFKQKWWEKLLRIERVYQEKELKENWYFFEISSHDVEDHPKNNILTIGFLRSYVKWKLPFMLIKPIYDYSNYKWKDEPNVFVPHFKDSSNEPIMQKSIDSGKLVKTYDVFSENEYQIAFWDTHFVLRWNYAEQLLYNDRKHKNGEIFWSYFWKDSRRNLKQLLRLDGTVFHTYEERDWKKLNKTLSKEEILDLHNTIYEQECHIEEMQEKAIYKFKDYDGEEIEATCHITYSEYVKGRGKFTRWLMSFFSKPECYTTLEIKFNKETGNKKGSYKGGTVGHSIEMLPKELPQNAFMRYCVKHDMKFSHVVTAESI
jgi:hypothetical protein